MPPLPLTLPAGAVDVEAFASRACCGALYTKRQAPFKPANTANISTLVHLLIPSLGLVMVSMTSEIN